MKSKRINQLKITLIDNYPDMLDNHWYGGWDQDRPKYKGRYKLNIWMLTPLRPVQLQTTLSWPPSDLARRQRWKTHAQQYEQWRQESQLIKDDIQRPSSIPPLLGMPSERQTLRTNKKGTMHKWYMPPVPSLVRAQLLKSNNTAFWNIQWLFPDQKLEFVLDQTNCKIEMWDNKDGGQSRVYMKTYAHKFNLPEDYYMPQHVERFVQEDIDYEYEEFKQRMSLLMNQEQTALTKQTFNELVVKFPVYAERMMQETQE